ncbi:MAG: type I-E CRISPR-associated protein Cse1/CasA [Desulfomonile tiedjei]|uniref:Type I-E CRISPR-associated protein Cse1/CasA n=1 Tax=Desulfomonile tiedjei TaxID=2358 RepID=A0A9D6UXF6_9BACT|nr:type I-E CRISPR-associated protein Cse1/CasA [Desulfomonile tiedjei]
MKQKTEAYNLLEEDWIPVLWSNGTFSRVGIRTALTKAGQIRQIAASNPMDNVALLRLLLAVLQWCKQSLSDEDRKEFGRQDGIPEAWLRRKLGTEKKPNPAFNLLGDPGHYQMLPSNTKTKPGPNVLLHEAPSGTNKAHFRHVRDSHAPMCLACCALGLTRLPAFTASEGREKFPGINQVPPIYFAPRSDTLLQVLLFQWPMSNPSHDRPVWDTGLEVITAEHHVGILEGFTFIPRKVRLGRPSAEDRCILCGRVDSVVTDIAFKKPSKEQVEIIKRRVLSKKWRDPDVAYLKEPQKSSSRDSVDTGSAKARDCLNDPWNSAGEWRQLWLQMLPSSTDAYIGAPSWLLKAHNEVGPHETVEVRAVGFATDRKANYFDVWEVTLELCAGIAQDSQGSAIVRQEADWLEDLIFKTIDAKTREWKKPVKKLRDAVFLSRTSERNRKQHDLRSALCQVRQQSETVLHSAFRDFIYVINSSASTEWENARKAWRRRVEGAVRHALRSAVTLTMHGSSLRRQEAIQKVDEAFRAAVRQLEEEEARAAKPKSEQPKGGGNESRSKVH